jgi:surfeit locus 1 family protein
MTLALRDAPRGARPLALRLTLALCALLAFIGLLALGSWQVQRLHWKHALIARVDARVTAPAVAAPAVAAWPQVTAADYEYRHVTVRGAYLYALTTPVIASTELGSGYWLLTPLCRDDGSLVLVNRGFVPSLPRKHPHPEHDPAVACHAGAAGGNAVTGLLRISEQGGRWLRHDDPASNHWYARDVAAIAAARGLPAAQVAPYFIDAAGGQEPADAPAPALGTERPTGGLTVISFPDNHLVYALTWYALAAMVSGDAWWVARDERRRR